MATEAATIAKRAAELLPLHDASLTEVYFYNSLSLCVIDAIYSIGAKYESTKATVIRYCNHYRVSRVRADRSAWPPRGAQEPMDTLVARIEAIGADEFAATSVRNRQRTSARGGILKAEAVLHFARVLVANDVRHFQDLDGRSNDPALDKALKSVKGQASGVSIQYFWMLTGDESLIKPDRMVLGFVSDTLGRPVAVAEATELLRTATPHLTPLNSKLTPRLLDYLIWEYQRGRQ